MIDRDKVATLGILVGCESHTLSRATMQQSIHVANNKFGSARGSLLRLLQTNKNITNDRFLKKDGMKFAYSAVELCLLLFEKE